MKIPKRTDPKHRPWPDAAAYVSETSYFDAPSLFAESMAETLPIEPNRTRLLDIGCGSGIIGIHCLVKKKADFVTFNDIQDEAIYETGWNVAMQIERGNIRAEQVDFIKGSLVNIPHNTVNQHSLIAFNPPQLPTDCLEAEHLRAITADPSIDTLSYWRV